MDWTGPALAHDLLPAARHSALVAASFSDRPEVRYRSWPGVRAGWSALAGAGVPRRAIPGLALATARTHQPMPFAFRTLAQQQLPDDVRDLFRRAESVGAYVGPYHAARMWELICLLDRFRPASVLELGAGTSTGLFARYHHGRFRSVEQAPEWIEKVTTIAGPDVECTQADAVTEDLDGEPVLRYDIDHAEPWDLVYVDGPANASGVTDFDADPQAGSLGCADVELMWQAGNRPIVVIDGRRSTIRRLVRTAPDGYRLHLKYELAEALLGVPPAFFLAHTVLVPS